MFLGSDFMEKNYIVTKSNKLISANYDLSLQEQKIILTLASMVQPQDTDFKEYEFKIKDFIELLGLKDQSKYTELPKITRDLKKKVFDIRDGNDIIQVSWLGGVRYKTKEGILILSLDKGLKPYMLELKELYTSYKLDNVLSLKSKYSIRFYEILKSNLFKQYFEIELEELKNMVGSREKAYDTYANFKNKVLLQAQKELKALTDISFDFEEIKTGRKVTSIKFIIKANKKVNAPKEKAPINEVSVDREETPLDTIEKDIKLIMDITKNEFSEKTAMLFRELSKGDISLVQKIYDYTTTKNITEGKVGYMRQLFKNFEEPIKSTGVGTTKFNNFEPRNKSARYLYLEEQCLLGQATEEERREFDEMR